MRRLEWRARRDPRTRSSRRGPRKLAHRRPADGPGPSPRGSEPIPAASRNRDAVTPFRSRTTIARGWRSEQACPAVSVGATGSVRFEGEAGRGPPLRIPSGGARGYHEPAMKRVLLLTASYGSGPHAAAPGSPPALERAGGARTGGGPLPGPVPPFFERAPPA